MFYRSAIRDAVTLDFETEKIKNRPDYPPKPVGLAVRYPDGDSEYMSWGHPSGNNCCKADVVGWLESLWREETPVLFFNAKFDLAVAHEKLGLPQLPWNRVHDAQFLAFLADPHSRNLDLKGLSDDLLGWPPEEQNAVAEWIWEHRRELVAKYGGKITRAKSGPNSAGAWLSKCPAEIVEPYAIGDVDRTHGLFEHLYPLINEYEMCDSYDRERRILPIFMENERDGMHVDLDLLENDVPKLQQSLTDADNLLRDMLGADDLNIDADAQLADALSEAGIVDDDDWVLTKTGQKSVAKDNLTYDMFQDEEVGHIYFYRNRLTTALSTFLNPWLEQASARHGIISTNWNQVRGGSGGTRCMPEGELVHTSRGYIQVQDVKVGDLVMSHKGEARAVTECTTHAPAPIVMLRTAKGLVLRTTEDHKYMTERGWVCAVDLEITDKILAASDTEEWRPCPDWPEFSVSSWGRIRYEKTDTIRALSKKNRWGHLKVMLARNGARKRGPDRRDFSVHRLVAQAFNVLGVGEEVRHLNGIAWDNTVDNLRWGTPSENRQDAKDHGTLWCRRYGNSKLDEEAVKDIRQSTASSKVMAKKYGLSKCGSGVRAIRRGERWPELDNLPPRPNNFRLVSIEGVAVLPEKKTYGLTVEIDHSHVTGGLVTHNTGRPSSSNPNFLNIPKEFKQDYDMPEGNEYGLEPLPFVRYYVLPDPGELFLHRDFDGQEMRLFAHYEDGPLLAAYQADPDLDPHGWVRDEIEELVGTALERTPVKILNFQALYGGGIPAAAKSIGCSTVKAREYKRFHDKALPGRIKLNDCIKEVIREGNPIRTWGGRCYYPEPRKIVGGQMRDFMYKMINYLCQGSAADVTKESIIRWYDHPKRDARFLVSVYDETNISAAEDNASEQMDILRETMESIEMDLLMKSSGKIGARWGELEECD